MKNSKIIFSILAVTVTLVCLVGFLLTDPQDAADIPSASDIDTETNTDVFTDVNNGGDTHTQEASEAPLPQETYSPEATTTVSLAPGVTVWQAEPDPSEVIDRDPSVTPDHPEYIQMEGGDQYFAVEGKVFRNDKILSIDVFDEYTGETNTISFGRITGACNRFLYLSPSCSAANGAEQYGFHFNTPVNSSGVVVTLNPTYSSEVEAQKAADAAPNVTLRRALDQKAPADYTAPNCPGAVWYTQTPIDGPTWIDVQVIHIDSGDWIATLRLTIDKADDGTYSIVGLENRNLLQCNDGSHLPDSELSYLCKMADAIIRDPRKVHCADAGRTTPFSEEQFLIEWLDSTTGLYYPYFASAGNAGTFVLGREVLASPVVAVSCRDFMLGSTFTIYLQVIELPTETENGVYDFIGYNHPLYRTISYLQSLGYIGAD